MYELRQGASRLMAALYNRKDDAAAVQKLAAALNYLPAQLEEDIAALHDFFQRAGDEKEADE